MALAVQKEIAFLQKRLKHPVYQIKGYFDLNKQGRKRLLDDFNITVQLVLALNKEHKSKGRWWKGPDAQFIDTFSYYWLSLYVINIYVKALSENSVIDTFLNDPNQGKKGVLADFREKIALKRFGFTFVYIFKRAKGLEECAALIDKYPHSITAEAINLRKLLKYRLLIFWFPVQLFFAKLLVRRYWPWKKSTVIKEKHLNDLEPYLRAGDILLHRTNFFVSNPTLLSFWTHTMLYDGKGHIIESTPYKVRKVKWKKAAAADYICVLRPKCSPSQKKKAVKYAESQIGKPYDFNFDFLSDEALVCSELILKGYPFLQAKLESKVGRLVYPSTNFIDLFNEGKLDFVYFLDSRLYSNKVILGTPKELAESYLRSKWDLLQK